MEMSDRKKVIKGLECCTKKICIYKDTEKECPYWELCGEYEDSFEDCTTALSKDALPLLKAQEPRVMTLEEIMMFDGAFIVEYNPERLSRCMNWAMFHFMDEKWVHIWRPRMVEHYAREQYSFTWRCWTSRPTEEQREATPWEI